MVASDVKKMATTVYEREIGDMDELINFEQVKPVLKQVKALAHLVTLITAALTPACCKFALWTV